jgi:hypothetical protein
VLRVEGDAREIRAFNVFAPVAFGGIRELPETLQDRSIIIRLKRAVREEIQGRRPFDSRKTHDEHELARRLARWGEDNLSRLEDAEPDMGELHNRQADNWRPLYAVADVAGGGWPKAVRRAMEALVMVDEEQSAAVQLLADIQETFNDRATRNLPYVDSIFSADLASALHKIEGRPWAEWGKQGKPITANAIARLLKIFTIASGTIRQGNDTAKGYKHEQFEDAFSRYLTISPVTTVTPSQSSNHAGFSDFQNVTQEPDVTDGNRLKASNHAGCDVVTVRNGGNGLKGTYPEDWTAEEIAEAEAEREALQDHMQ